MPSPLSTVSQRVGLTDITIEYSRPGVKERTIFGELVPYGEMWRTGANKNTTIELSTDAKLGGQDVKAGTYSVFTIPGKNDWEVVLSSKLDHYGTGDYLPENDVARFKASVSAIEPTETFTIDVANVTSESATIQLRWESTMASIDVAVNPHDQAIKNIQEAIAAEDATFGTYRNSARYYIDNNIDAEMALEWAKQSVEMDKRFWNVHTLARAYHANGQLKQAIVTANESKMMAEKADYETYVNMNVKLINKIEAEMKQ